MSMANHNLKEFASVFLNMCCEKSLVGVGGKGVGQNIHQQSKFKK
jgi:hypothetical protein